MKFQNLPPRRDRLVTIMRALGNPARFKILEYLAACPGCIVADIVEQTPLAQSTVSQHLKVLRDAGLIRGEIEGPAMNYCLNREAFRWLADELRELADHVENCCESPPM
jgi:DNA-binding transcriptional ArsR family regulator